MLNFFNVIFHSLECCKQNSIVLRGHKGISEAGTVCQNLVTENKNYVHGYIPQVLG